MTTTDTKTPTPTQRIVATGARMGLQRCRDGVLRPAADTAEPLPLDLPYALRCIALAGVEVY